MSLFWTTIPGFILVLAVFLTCCIQISVCSLGDTCDSDDNCTSVVQNSSCNNRVCQCSDGYYEKNTTTCLPKIGYNMTCTTGDVCSDPNAVCNTTNKCLCKAGYFWSQSSSVCKQKIGYNMACTTGDVCSDPNAVCNTTNKCLCTEGYFWSQSSNECKLKIDYNMTCTTDDVCSDPNAVCSTDKCLCKEGYFWSQSSSECKLISDFTPKNIQFSGTNRENTTVTWQQDGSVSEISRYEISWTPDDGNKTESHTSRESVITNLKAGTEYTVTVTTVINDNTRTGETATVTTIQALTKNCSNPTRDCGKQQYSAECSETGFCRCVSGKYRNKDGTCHPVDELKPKSFTDTEVLFWSVKLTWTQSDYISQVADPTILYEVSVGSSQKNLSGTSVTVSGLKAGSSYTASIVTILDQDGKSERINSNESPKFTTKKILNNETCKAGDVCSDSNAFCSSTNPTRCLCNEGYFWGPTPLTCTQVSELKPEINGVSRTGTTSLHVNWTPDAQYGQYVTSYDIIWTPSDTGSRFVYPNNTGDIKGLTPGKQYSVQVRAFIDQEGRVQFADSASISERTFPDTPGPFDTEESNLTAPDITLYFKKSEGTVDHYIVTLTGDSDSYNQTQNVTPSGENLQVVYFSDITPGNYYTVHITAVSSGVYSQTYTHSGIRGSVKSPGKVKSLSVSDITYSSMFVSWNRPDNPNGVIFAYILTLQLKSNDSCQQKVVFYCNDCNNMSNVDHDMHCEGVTPVKVNVNSSVLNDAGKEFSYNLTHLLPFTNYTVSVFTYNEFSSGQTSKVYQMTETKPAAPPDNFRVSEITSSSVTVTWSPESPQPGKTDYTLTVYEKAETGKQDTIVKNEIIKGWSSNDYTAQNLSSYWDYKFELTANTSAGISQPVWITDYIKTNQSAPTAPINFNVSHTDNYTAVMVTYDCPKQKDGRNGVITSSVLVYNTSMESNDVITNSFSIENTNDCHFSISVPVTAEIKYNFYVRLKTIYDGETATTSFDTPPGPPILVIQSTIKEPSETSPFENGFVVDICPKCLYQPTTGKISLAGVIVAREDIKANRRKRQLSYKEDYDKYTNWFTAKQKNFKIPYRATNDSWIDTGLNNYKYRIGDVDCNERHDFCNGQLPDGTKFVVEIFACTKGGCTQTKGPTYETKSKDTTSVGLIIGIVIAVAVILVLVIVIAFLIKKRKSRYPGGKYKPGGSDGEELPEIDKTRPVTMADFKQHVETLHKDSNLLFSQEYEDLTSLSPNHPRLHSEMDGNRVKNRYVNILPFDHSRVKLLPLDEDPERDDSSDYINANYIPGYKGPREYIATQGPMTGTIADFWRMMWEQHSTLIVMLSDLQEKGKPKVDQYWPGNLYEPVNYGEITLELTSMSTMNKFTIRIFKMTLGKEERLVRQYFIPGWEDYSANLTPEDVINFIQTIRREIRPTSDCGPIVVHCSAGVGRSGTFIALDVFQQWVDEHGLDDELDVFEYVLKMRNNRQHMVQTEKQYIFIHDTLNVMIEKRKSILCPPDDNIYANKDMFDNKAFEPEEENLYQNVQQIKTPNTPTTVL